MKTRKPDLRHYIKHCGCDKKDAPEKCWSCGKAFRRYHVHYFQAQAPYTACPRCADEAGAC